MHRAHAIGQFERRLAELGCPPRELRRYAEEIADHHEDLKEAALEEGLAEAEAEARATRLLGEPVALAERFAAVLRQSSWFGRHRVLTFCILPPVGIFAASIFGLGVALGLLRLYYSADEWSVLAGEGDGWNPIALGVRTSWYVAMGLVTLVFCWLSRRCSAGIGWALAACVVCSIQSLFGFCSVVPHSTTIGYSLSPNWHCALLPLVIGSAIYALHQRARSRWVAVLGPAEREATNDENYCKSSNAYEGHRDVESGEQVDGGSSAGGHPGHRVGRHPVRRVRGE
ncbi:MAG TPA: permease prefix domain 1-containing protein [Verrucomicrobiae bacterium]